MCGGLLISSAVTSAAREAQRRHSLPLSFPTASIYHLLNGGHLWHTDQIACIYQRGKNTFVDSIYLTRVHSASIMQQIEVLGTEQEQGFELKTSTHGSRGCEHKMCTLKKVMEVGGE